MRVNWGILTCVIFLIGIIPFVSLDAYAGAVAYLPQAGTTWQWQLADLPVDESFNVQMYDVDLFDVPESTVTSLHNQGKNVICYFSAGSWEDWRPDAADFPASVLGDALDPPFDNEKWLDIRDIATLGPIMEARMDLCVQKGFDGVEPDNIDGYTNISGFDISYQDQINYNTFLAQAAHARGLSIALKNDIDQVNDLVNIFDYAVVEQCYEFNECNGYSPFIAQNKPVFQTEYNAALDEFCPESLSLGFSGILKNLNLDVYMESCNADTDDFSDIPLGGTTSGTITTRGDQTLIISDEPNPDGIKITADIGGGPTAATILVCSGLSTISLDAGDEIVVLCGSATVSIITGSVDVLFTVGGVPATTTMNPSDSITFDDDTLTFTNNSATTTAEITIGSQTIILSPGETLSVTFPSSGSTSYQDPNLGDVRHGQGHNDGFCMNQNCIDVDGFFNHFPETTVPQGSTQTFSLLINCPRGTNTCNHASIEGVLPDSDFYEEQWGVTLDRLPRSNTWETAVDNPYGEIGEVTTTVQEVDQSFLSVSFNIEFLIPGSVGTFDGIGDPHENNRHLHVTVWDSNRGISNYIFNEGIYVDDIYAYPKVETSYEPPLELKPLCLNENPNKRYTCAFDKVREWTIKNAEKALLEIEGITELDVLNEEFLAKFRELKQAIVDEDSEKNYELRMQLYELGIKIHNMKQ